MTRETFPPDSGPTEAATLRIGACLVHPELNRLTRNGETIQVEPRIMQVLVCLARRPGEVVTREALLEAVWADTVVQEEALTHAVSRLRRAFGDDARTARTIETIPKRGYRLVAPVEALCDGAGGASSAADGTQSASARRPWLLPALLLLAVLLVVTLGWWRGAGEARHTLLEGVPLTSQPGREVTPAISADGTHVAFAWNGGEGLEFDLYVRQRGSDSSHRLTEEAGQEHSPAFSPEGDRLAFIREQPGETSIHVLPILGGVARRLFSVPYRGGIDGVDWDPRGPRLVTAVQRPNEAWTLFEISTAEGEATPLFAPPEGEVGDRDPCFSPDGARIAFVRADRLGLQELFVVDASGGEPRQLTFDQASIRGLAWTPDGDALIFSSGTARAGEFRLWRVAIADGRITWLPTRGRRSIQPAVAAETGALVYAEETYHRHLEKVSLVDEGEPAPFAPSTHSEYDARYSPSGERIAFISTRSGHPEVWVCDRDGERPRRLTSFGGAQLEFVRWSPDESRLAFDGTTGSRIAVHVAELESGRIRTLTSSGTSERLLGWSRDGGSIYLRSLEDEGWRTQRASLESGEIEEVLDHDTYMLAETQDGTSLLYVKAGQPALWRSALDGSAEELVFDGEGTAMPCYWRAAPDGLFLYQRDGAALSLAFHDLAQRETHELAPLPVQRVGLLDVAPDGSELLYDRTERVETDLIVVEATR